MSDQACAWVWHSEPTPNTIDVIKDASGELEHVRTVLSANEESFVALTDAPTKQCRGETGAVIRESPIGDTSPSLADRVRKDGATCLSETRD